MSTRILLGFAILVSATPAWAQESATVPEGSHLTLFALGLLGVIIGRRASMRSGRKERAPDANAE